MWRLHSTTSLMSENHNISCLVSRLHPRPRLRPRLTALTIAACTDSGHMLQLQPGSVMISCDPLSPDYSDNKTNLAFTRRPIITMILIGCRLHGRSLALFFFPLGFDALCTLSPFMSLLCPFAFVYSSMNGYPLSLGL